MAGAQHALTSYKRLKVKVTQLSHVLSVWLCTLIQLISLLICTEICNLRNMYCFQKFTVERSGVQWDAMLVKQKPKVARTVFVYCHRFDAVDRPVM